MRFHDELIDRMFPARAPFCEWLPQAETTAAFTESDRAGAKALWEAHRATGGNAWKDPRTSLFLDLWKDVLPNAKIIVCSRHPYQVHLSLMRRGEPFLHVDYAAGIAGWTIYNRRIMKSLAGLAREKFMVIEVDVAFRDPQRLTETLARFLKIPLTEKARGTIAPDAFNFEDAYRDALDRFGDFFPEAAAVHREMQGFTAASQTSSPMGPTRALPIQSPEARLIEFEEAHGLRAKAKKMLVRSVAVDRERSADLYHRMARVCAEKDGLIDDLTRLTEGLKRRVAELERMQAAASR